MCHFESLFSFSQDKYPEVELLGCITTTWMELEGILLSGVSLTEKDKYRMISLIWGM